MSFLRFLLCIPPRAFASLPLASVTLGAMLGCASSSGDPSSDGGPANTPDSATTATGDGGAASDGASSARRPDSGTDAGPPVPTTCTPTADRPCVRRVFGSSGGQDNHNMCALIDTTTEKGVLECWGGAMPPGFDPNTAVTGPLEPLRLRFTNEPGQDPEARIGAAYTPQRVDVGNAGPVAELAMNSAVACVTNDKRELRCWGKNTDPSGNATFLLGTVSKNSSLALRPSASLMPIATDVASVSLGGPVACLQHSDRTVDCWGFDDGSTGIATGATQRDNFYNVSHNLYVPTRSVTLSKLQSAQIFVAEQVSTLNMLQRPEITDFTPSIASIDGPSAGRVVTVGPFNARDGWWNSTYPAPASPVSVSRIVNVGGFQGSVCTLLSNGQVTCWGTNKTGIELVAPIENQANEVFGDPINVGLSGIAALSAGAGTVCALDGDGLVWCWGWCREGECGQDPLAAEGVVNYTDSSFNKRTALLTPTAVPGVRGAVELATSGSAFCARISDGSLTCWGTYGEAGAGAPPGPLDRGSSPPLSVRPTVVSQWE